MKKILSAFMLLTTAQALPALSANAQDYTVTPKDIRDGYVTEKIWLQNYALPQVSIAGITYTNDVQLPAGAAVGNPANIKVGIGMERKRAFALVRVPVFAAATAAGHVNQVSAFVLDVKESATPAKKTTGFNDVPNSVLASGTWYKIGITKTGVYKIDYSFLAAMGIKPESVTTANIRIMGNGGHALSENNAVSRPADLLENAIVVNDGGDNTFNNNDYLLFYATGPMGWDKDSANQRFTHLQNLYSDTAFYFISFDGNVPGKRIGTQSGAPSANVTANGFNYYDVHDLDLINPPTFGKLWYGETFNAQLGNTTQTFTFDIGAQVSDVYCSVSFGSIANYNGNMAVITLNGNTVGAQAYSATSVDNLMSLATISHSAACNSSTANVTVDFRPIDASGIGYLNYIEINARRPLTMSGDQMGFRDWASVGAGKIAGYALQGAGNDTRVWDVTDPQNPVIMAGSLGGSTYSFAQDAQALHEFMAVNPVYLAPKYSGIVPNQNLHATPQVTNIIVTNPQFLDQANQLADYHRTHDNMTVAVATTEQIYNEFSSGAQDISAIRDYARMLYKRAGSDVTKMPRYITLFGGASYDYKNRTNNNSNFVPVFESANSTDDIDGFMTDDFYSFLDDEENIEDPNIFNAMDIAVGRIPARSQDNATDAVNKIKGYAAPATLGPWRISNMFVADNNDYAGEHMLDAEDMAETVVADAKNLYNEHKVYVDATPTVSTPAGSRCPDANAVINDQVYKGTFMINYNGHGNTQVWATERILTQDDYNNWNNPNTLPFMITATCDFGQFDHPQYVSAAEQLVLRNNGGVVVVLTTTAAVYATYNHDINVDYLTAQYTRNADFSWNSFGDAYLIGKNITYASSAFSDKIANFRKFALLGDPALTPDFPKNAVRIDSVTDVATGSHADTVKALGAFVMNGSVRDNSGNTMTDFNGTLYVTFYDKPRTITTISGTDQTFKLQDNIVYKGRGTVTNGLFTFTFIAPKDLNYYFGTGKLSIYAENGITDAAGADTSVTVGGFSDHPVLSTEAPIVKAYINDSLFLNGGITGNNTSLFASLYSETGINVSGNNVGHDLVGVLDGNSETPYILNDYYETAPNTYQRGYVYFPISGLADGKHNIKITAWDVNDNTGSGDVDFVVVDGKVVDIQNLMNYPNPFGNTTHFVFEHNHPDEELNVKIDIFNTGGSLVRQINQDFTPSGSRSADITWDGTDNSGARLPSGVYVYRLNVTSEKGFRASAYQKLVIVR